MSSDLRLVGDRILLDPIQPKAEAASGIILPETSRWLDEACTGIVVAVGSGYVTPKGVTMPHSVAVGDVVIYNPEGGLEMRLAVDEDPFYIVPDSAVVAKIED